MKPLPKADGALLVRTDFSDNTVWDEVCATARLPDPQIQAALDMMATFGGGGQIAQAETPLRVVNDRSYGDATVEQLLKAMRPGPNRALLFVADRLTMSHPEHAILVVDAGMQPDRAFRALPSQTSAIEGNLAVANMDWEDFAQAVGADGVFRGFPK